MQSDLLAALSLLLFGLVSAVFPVSLDEFQWPADVVQILRSKGYSPVSNSYTERQADDFLANAMLHLTDLARTETLVSNQKGLFTTPFLPQHRLVTDGMEQAINGRRHASSWFSLPLLVESPHNPHYLEFRLERLEDSKIVPSLDLIRFDRFRPRTMNGFWLPTAIVRPYVRTSISHLQFKVMYEFPTSAARYRENFRVNPDQAPALLQQALQQKEGIWLGKLDPHTRGSISSMWRQAIHSPLIPESSFFGPEDKALFREYGRLGLEAVPGQHTPTVELSSDSDVNTNIGTSSSSDDEGPQVLHGVPTAVNQARAGNIVQEVPGPSHEFSRFTLHGFPVSRQGPFAPILNYPGTLHERLLYDSIAGRNAHDIARSSSSVPQVPDRGAAVVEHNLFDGKQDSIPSQPTRPTALYPWEQRPSQSPQQSQADSTPPYLHSLQQEANINLGLSLAPSRRIPGPEWDH